MNKRILIVDDEPLTRQSLYEILKFEGYDVVTANDGLEALETIKKISPQIAIVDLKMPRLDGLGLLKEIKANSIKTEIILITGYGSIETAVEAMKQGAFDYISKPIVDSEIKVVIQKILNQQRLLEENRLLKERLAASNRQSFHGIIGGDPQMQKIYSTIEAVCDTNATILLTGESGTGKRVIAHAIHNSDPSRRDKPFIEVNCGALPETLLESELFGHIKGSFTGAIKDRIGRYELADKGTILLDEIDAFTPNLQVKLLRLLQSGEFERVGESHTIKVDARVIASTNQDLSKAIEKGTFREDLFYRLNVIPIHIPPLRERRDDIPLLVEHFLKNCNQRNNGKRAVTAVSGDAMKTLLKYEWPGNIRELENVIERAIILSKGHDIITRQDLPELLQESGRAASGDNINTINNQKEGFLKEVLKHPEKQIIQNSLEEASWNRKQAAANLGINRSTLYNKMKKYGLLNERRDNG